MNNMKKLMRIAAALSFGSCFVAGLITIGFAISSFGAYRGYSEAGPQAVVGLLLISAAFFAGSVIWFLAEKCYPSQNNQ